MWNAIAEFSKMDEETSDLGLDQESDEDEFWNAQTDLECNDEGIEEEENNNIISSISLREHNKETEKEKNSQRVKYYENRPQRKGKLGLKMMFYLSCSLILFGGMTLGAENSTYFKMNKIHKGNIKPPHQNRSEEKRLDKRDINEEAFKAFMCNEDDEVSTAEFSLNTPPRCNREDGSVYYPPIEKNAQILQKIRRIPIEVTICQVEWRVNIKWCGGEYTALNYMHSDIQTKRTNILPNNVQCHHASPNDTLELEVPEYGSINSIRVRMKCWTSIFPARGILQTKL